MSTSHARPGVVPAGSAASGASRAAEAAAISARLDRLPATRYVWTLVLLLSLGGLFEFYDLFLSAYVAPGLIKSGIFTATTKSFFGFTGFASFVAAFFLGLFFGTILLGFVADRFGRKSIFTFSLLWYSVATVIMAFQNTADGLNLWRFIAGLGVGVELVTIDTYISELVPAHIRGRAFAINQTIQFAAVPIVAALGWWLVPQAPLGLDGWRWLMLIGAAGAVVVWWIRLRVPESPRWLATHGRLEDAERATTQMEARVQAELGAPLPPPGPPVEVVARGSFVEIWRPPYLNRTVMFILFNIFQTVGFYGFANWVPTLLIAKGITITHSLQYTFIIAIASPLSPLICTLFADKIERKWQIVIAAAGVGITGLIFAALSAPATIIIAGVVLTFFSNMMSFAFHTYQPELYPTRIRAVAVGFVYSWSRLSVVFMAFVIAWALREFGVPGVFVLIAGSMVIVVLAIALLGPRTRDRPLESISH